jgi:TonB-dependent SusC/RagA subfamily outer membrane receptor
MAYDKPDAEVLITNQFSGYPNVFEVLRGRVAGVKVDEVNGAYNIRIRGINSISLGSKPLFLIDGIKKSYDDLISLPVSFIDRIDVLKSAGTTASYGVRGSNGVISIITRTGDRVLPNASVNHSVNVKISGYDAARVFYSPQHATSSVPTYEPDLRTTLFWEPDIHLRSSENVSLYYYNADKASTIRVIVEGITTSGIPVACKTEYKIKE